MAPPSKKGHLCCKVRRNWDLRLKGTETLWKWDLKKEVCLKLGQVWETMPSPPSCSQTVWRICSRELWGWSNKHFLESWGVLVQTGAEAPSSCAYPSAPYLLLLHFALLCDFPFLLPNLSGGEGTPSFSSSCPAVCSLSCFLEAATHPSGTNFVSSIF